MNSDILKNYKKENKKKFIVSINYNGILMGHFTIKAKNEEEVKNFLNVRIERP